MERFRRALPYLIVFIAVIVSALNIGRTPFIARADEGCYFQYASQVAQKGLSGFAEIFKEYVSN
ncbi:MAG: hypothetical protein WC417_01650, partial [Candidatus Omnitrophota bacterium]